MYKDRKIDKEREQSEEKERKIGEWENDKKEVKER